MTASPFSVFTQGYPARPIRFIVGFVPAGLLPAITRKLNDMLTRARNTAEFKEQFSGLDIEAFNATLEIFVAYVKTELAKWTKTLKETGISETP